MERIKLVCRIPPDGEDTYGENQASLSYPTHGVE